MAIFSPLYITDNSQLCWSYCGLCCDPRALGPVGPALLFLPRTVFHNHHVHILITLKSMSLVPTSLLEF